MVSEPTLKPRDRLIRDASRCTQRHQQIGRESDLRCGHLHGLLCGTKPPFAHAATAHAEERGTFATLHLAFFAHFS